MERVQEFVKRFAGADFYQPGLRIQHGNDDCRNINREIGWAGYINVSACSDTRRRPFSEVFRYFVSQAASGVGLWIIALGDNEDRQPAGQASTGGIAIRYRFNHRDGG